jgi:hypothetical protein
MSFKRPGEQQHSAFGISFDADRDAQATPSSLSTYNKNEHLAISQQRQRLPVAAHRREILYLMETHATVIVVGETGTPCRKVTSCACVVREGEPTESSDTAIFSECPGGLRKRRSAAADD